MGREGEGEAKGLSFVHPPYATAPAAAPGAGMASLSPAGPLEGPSGVCEGERESEEEGGREGGRGALVSVCVLLSGPVVATARGRAKLQQYFKGV